MSDGAWKDYLDDGEEILWQGAPSGAGRFPLRKSPRIIGALFFIGFSLFWMSQAWQAGGIFWMFGLIFLAVGLRNIYRDFLRDFLELRNSHYTLTDRRAFIATQMPILGRALRSYPIDDKTKIDYSFDPVPAVYFADDARLGRVHVGWPAAATPSRVGFQQITDPEAVYRIMRRIQTGQIARSDRSGDFR